jgi:hypothetical protein
LGRTGVPVEASAKTGGREMGAIFIGKGGEKSIFMLWQMKENLA